MEQEGVIKFTLDYRCGECGIPSSSLSDINRARSLMRQHQMIGQDDSRYEGYGFGNLSCRMSGTDKFWVSGSQTGQLATLDANDIALINRVELDRNYIQVTGLTEPSSESLSHAALYQVDDAIEAVIHVHCPIIWQADSQEIGIARTSESTPYGTPAMASELKELANSLYIDSLNDRFPVIAMAMGGHEDGVIVAGHSLDACAHYLCDLQSRVIQMNNIRE